MPSAAKPSPNPDKVALIRAGQVVRKRLAETPEVERIPAEAAEIFGVRDFLSAEECARLVTLIDRVAKPSELFEESQKREFRTSYSGNIDPADPLVAAVEARIDNLLGLPHAFGETVQGQRYQPGQEFRAHMDWFSTREPYWKEQSRLGGQRCFTAMAYLNTVEEGGSTDFPNIGLSIPPQRGALLIWNNARVDGTPNDMTLHAGTPVIRGTKYIITKWYRTRRWGY